MSPRTGQGDLNPGTYIATRPVVAPEVARAAALTVCSNAHDTDDARDLLAVLGLDRTP